MKWTLVSSSAVAAAVALAACGTEQQITTQFLDARATARETPSGIESSLVSANGQQLATLDWRYGAASCSAVVDGQQRVLPLGAGQALTANNAGEALHGLWGATQAAASAQRCFCGLGDYYIASSSCGRLQDAGGMYQCMRDVLNDICCL